MELKQLSVSQAETFDHDQQGGCERKWWFDAVQGLKPDQDNAKTEGTLGHALLAHYFKTGEAPAKRVKMGKAVTAAIAKGDLPKPGPDLMVETRFSGQQQRDEAGAWIPLDTNKALWLGGLPWDGMIDLRWRRDDMATVLDHKFTSDIEAYAKKPSQLINTVQMPVYVLDSMRLWPDVRSFEIAHHYLSKGGAVSKIVRDTVTRDQVLERAAQIEQLVPRMQQVATVGIEHQDEVRANSSGPGRACDAYGGCKHQSICSAFKARQKVQLTAEEIAALGGLDEPTPEPVVEASPVPTEAAVLDDVPAPAEFTDDARELPSDGAPDIAEIALGKDPHGDVHAAVAALRRETSAPLQHAAKPLGVQITVTFSPETLDALSQLVTALEASRK